MNRNMEVYDRIDKVLFDVFAVESNAEQDVLYRLSLLVALYSALQGRGKFTILELCTVLKDINIKTISTREDIHNCIEKIRKNIVQHNYTVDAFSLITKYLFWSKYSTNKDNPSNYQHFYIYDRNVVDKLTKSGKKFTKRNYLSFSQAMEEVKNHEDIKCNKDFDRKMWK